MRPRLSRTTVGLAVGITAAVSLACGAGALLYSRHHFGTLLERERGTALAEGELMRAALEHQMIENDRSLISQVVQRFGREPRVVNVMLLDRHGIVRHASAPVAADSSLGIGSPTCQACHRFPPDQRGSSRVIEADGGQMLRTVIPFRNREACHRCHNPDHRLNGVLIYDRDVGELRASMNAELRWLVAGTGTLALLLIGVIAAIVRFVVLRRLQRFETTARLIAAGDLEKRVPTGGSDTISWLAQEFNTMADSVTGLVGEVRRQRERLETVINSIDDGIVVLDPKREIVAANTAFLERVRRSRQYVLGCSCSHAAAGLCGVADCPTLACLASGERQVRLCERHGLEGEVRWEEVHASPIRDASGAISQVVEVWRDISDRRAAEARLAESHRLASLGVLASGFSHELNTPLATVLTCVEGILRDANMTNASGSWPRVGEHASIARDQVLRCRGITQHFLRLSRGQPSAADVLDAGAVVAAVARLVEPTARAQGVTIEQTVAPGLYVRVDEAELQHATLNLLLNAVQASPAGATVRLAAAGGDAVLITIADEGCGIAPEHQVRIFEPFFSLRAGGTGLGLFLSVSFVRRWGGDIHVRSTPGEGSTFEIRLPHAVRPGAARAAS
jgi:PAS domain S-box-containing protein